MWDAVEELEISEGTYLIVQHRKLGGSLLFGVGGAGQWNHLHLVMHLCKSLLKHTLKQKVTETVKQNLYYEEAVQIFYYLNYLVINSNL